MKLLKSIKEFVLKILAWFFHFFKKSKKARISKSNKKINKSIKTPFKASVNRDETISNNVIACYPGVLPKELESLNTKIETIRKKVLVYNDENIEEEIENIEKISQMISNKKILVNHIDELNNIVDEIILDQELHLNTNEKISILKDNITNLFDENLKDYEKHIIKKAYYEHEKVNYVIVTSMLIDDLYNDLNKANESYNKNHYSKNQFVQKIREIEKKLERLEKINNREEVQKEIEALKNDLYTKRKDKYDLLYNSEIFINIGKQCDEILKQIVIKEQQEKEIKIAKQNQDELLKKEEKLHKDKQDKKKKKERDKKEDEVQEEKEIEDNILKRFMDLELARQILLKRDLEKIKKGNKEDIIENTLLSYQEFLLGDNHEFNFTRNKLKLEVAKLYNDTLRNICILDNGPYYPVEHLNIKFSDMINQTIENQQRLNMLLIEKKKVNIEENELSLKVTEKLTNVLEKEKVREEIKGKPKILVRTYKSPSNSEEEKN